MKFLDENEKVEENEPDDFVGTAEYVSPEVLNKEKQGLGCDIWALGCMIYLFFHGVTPFKDKTDFRIFEKIQNLDYKLNKKDLPDEVQDIIKKILVLDPSKRLGSGSQDDNLDILALKSHSFFKGINFNDEIFNTPEEISSFVFSPLKPRIKDNSDTDCMESFSLSPCIRIQTVKSVGNLLHFDLDPPEIMPQNFLIYESIVDKKSPYLHYNTRKLKLYSDSVLKYYEPKSNEIKGSIQLDNKCKAVYENNKKFQLVTPNRTYYFRCQSNNADEWTSNINNSIKDNYSPFDK